VSQVYSKYGDLEVRDKSKLPETGNSRWSYANWLELFGMAGLIGIPGLQFLEIGCFQGKTTRWLLENVLTDESSRITCIDTFQGSTDQSAAQKINMFSIFEKNIIDYSYKVTVYKGKSSEGLIDEIIRSNQYDFIYVDADHRARYALEDAVLAFRLLKAKGIMIFDDYWGVPMDNIRTLDGAKIAIDAFLNVYSGFYNVVDYNYQISIQRKNRDFDEN